jgi:hypothetical protein
MHEQPNAVENANKVYIECLQPRLHRVSIDVTSGPKEVVFVLNAHIQGSEVDEPPLLEGSRDTSQWKKIAEGPSSAAIEGPGLDTSRRAIRQLFAGRFLANANPMPLAALVIYVLSELFEVRRVRPQKRTRATGDSESAIMMLDTYGISKSNGELWAATVCGDGTQKFVAARAMYTWRSLCRGLYLRNYSFCFNRLARQPLERIADRGCLPHT